MKVLFLSLVFSDRKHTNFYEELLEVFVRNGHKVFVACSNDSKSIEPDGVQDWNGMTVLRIKTGDITGTTNIIKKGFATLSIDYYFKRALRKYYKNEKFDLILYPTPPITLANTIAWAKKILWSENIFDVEGYISSKCCRSWDDAENRIEGNYI